MAVDGSTGHQDLLRLLRLVAGPGIIIGQILAQVPGEHRAVQRADGGNIQCGCLFEQCLHLRAVLAHDVQVIPAGFAGPVGLFVKLCHRPEAAETVGGEQHLFAALIADHDLRPVHHGCKHKGEGVASQRQALAVLHHHTALLGHGIRAEELLHIHKGLGVAHHLHVRVLSGQAGNVGTMVRLHVGDHQIFRHAVAQRFGEVCQPGIRGTVVHRVQNGDLFIQNDIGVVADAGWHRVLTFKQVDGGIVHPHAQNGIADLLYAHKSHAPLFLCCAAESGRFFLRTIPSIAYRQKFSKRDLRLFPPGPLTTTVIHRPCFPAGGQTRGGPARCPAPAGPQRWRHPSSVRPAICG